MVTDEGFPILGIDYIELYVGSAKQTAYFLGEAFGFEEIAYAGLETGRKNKVSHVLVQSDVCLVVTGALSHESAVAQHVMLHGDGVKDIALRVPSVEDAYRIALSRGAISLMWPTTIQDQHGTIVKAAIGTYGDTIHSLIERQDYNGPFLPGYKAVKRAGRAGVGLKAVDHIVGNVELGKMDTWARYYEQVMGFTNLVHYTDSQISTEYSALMSKVMWDGSGKIKFPINEPAIGKRKSQIDEYLSFYGGPGVQHIALETDSIVDTVTKLRARGVQFLHIPPAYYVDAAVHFSDVPEVDIRSLAERGILMDRDEEGYLLQIFTKPPVDRPTLFFEIIERHGSRGFGLGNFKALFEAIEREQALRGTL